MYTHQLKEWFRGLLTKYAWCNGDVCVLKFFNSNYLINTYNAYIWIMQAVDILFMFIRKKVELHKLFFPRFFATLDRFVTVIDLFLFRIPLFLNDTMHYCFSNSLAFVWNFLRRLMFVISWVVNIHGLFSLTEASTKPSWITIASPMWKKILLVQST